MPSWSSPAAHPAGRPPRPRCRTALLELIDLGSRRFDLQGESRKALETYGVPPEQIIAIPDVSRTTEPELALVRDAAQARGYRRLILVSSPEHTRRVKIV